MISIRSRLVKYLGTVEHPQVVVYVEPLGPDG